MNQPLSTPKRWDNIEVGKLGIWLFLLTEVMLFGAFFAAYLSSRWGNTACNLGTVAWPQSGYSTSLGIAFVNTVILITSSFTMVRAGIFAQEKNVSGFKTNMLLTIALGFLFLVLKTGEYILKIHHGYYPHSGFLKQNPGLSIFISYYFLMTGFHALHIIIGLIWNSFVYKSFNVSGLNEALTKKVEYAGLYWHFVDVVWVFLFPLFYLI